MPWDKSHKTQYKLLISHKFAQVSLVVGLHLEGSWCMGCSSCTHGSQFCVRWVTVSVQVKT